MIDVHHLRHHPPEVTPHGNGDLFTFLGRLLGVGQSKVL